MKDSGERMQPGFRRPWENDETRNGVVLTFGGIWILLVAWMALPTAFQREETEMFAFQRVAESVAVQDFARSSFPDWLAAWGGFDEETLREEAGRVFDARIARNEFPSRVAPHWAAMFLLIEDPDRAEAARGRIDESDPIQARQAEVIDVLSGEQDADRELIGWAQERYLQGLSELPEWIFLQETEGNSRIDQWMSERGSHVVLRGMAAHFLTILVVGFAIIGSLLFLVRRDELKFAGSSPLLERKGWRLRYLLREFFLAEILGLIGAVVAAFALSPFGLGDLVMIVSGLVFVVIPPIWLSLRLTPGISASARLFRVRGSGWTPLQLFAFVASGMGLFLLGAGAILLLDREGSSITDSIEADGIDTMTHVLWNYFFAVVLAPISEEWVFRGFLFGGLRHRCGAIPAALLSSGIFAVLHGYSVVGLFAVFGYGLAFCWIYQRSGSLLPGILVHALFNFIATSEVVGWYSFH